MMPLFKPRLRLPRPIRLNPAYLSRHGIVPLALSDDRLTIGMANVDDAAAITTLQLATGYVIEPVEICAAQIAEHLGGTGHPLVAPGGDAGNGVAGWLLARSGVDVGVASLAPLVQLLEVGYDPAEAGSILAQSPAAGIFAGPVLRTVGTRLRSGMPLDTALSHCPGLGEWLACAIGACRTPSDQVKALGGLARTEGALARCRIGAKRLVPEAAIWSLPISLAWSLHSLAASLAIGLFCMAVLARIGWVMGHRPREEFDRAAGLMTTAVLAELAMPPASAIRAGLHRFASKRAAPSARAALAWHGLADSREDLALALRLPPAPAALLMRGDLADAASQASAHCVREGTRLARIGRWVVHGLGLVTVAIAIAALPA